MCNLYLIGSSLGLSLLFVFPNLDAKVIFSGFPPNIWGEKKGRCQEFSDWGLTLPKRGL